MKRTTIKKSQLKEIIAEVIKELDVIDYIKSADEAGDDSISGPGVSLAKDNSSFIYFTMSGGGALSDFKDTLSSQVNVAKVKSVTRRLFRGSDSQPVLDVEVTSTTGDVGPRELGAPADVTFRVYANSATGSTPTLLIQALTRYGDHRVIFYSEDDAKKFINGALSVANADDKDLIKNGYGGDQPPMADPSSLQYISSGASKNATRAYNAIKALN